MISTEKRVCCGGQAVVS